MTAGRQPNMFPCEIEQPDQSFRFSADAAWLVDFTLGEGDGDAGTGVGRGIALGARVADLGAGCGVAGLGLLIRRPDLTLVGIERDPELADAARRNARTLNLPGAHVVTGDVAEDETLRQALELIRQQGGGRQFDAVICNPPWRLLGSGRLPPSAARRDALFGNAETLPVFCRAADALLRNHGRLFLVVGAARLADVLAALPRRLRPVRLRCVHHRPDAEASLVLLEARKNSRAGLTVEAPLVCEAPVGKNFV